MSTLRNSPSPELLFNFMSEVGPLVLQVRRECNDDPLIIHKITTTLFREIDRRAAARKRQARRVRSLRRRLVRRESKLPPSPMSGPISKLER